MSEIVKAQCDDCELLTGLIEVIEGLEADKVELLRMLDNQERRRYTHEEAGRKGGEKTRERHGFPHFHNVGRKGGLVTAQRGRDFYIEIGKKAWEARLAKKAERERAEQSAASGVLQEQGEP